MACRMRSQDAPMRSLAARAPAASRRFCANSAQQERAEFLAIAGDECGLVDRARLQLGRRSREQPFLQPRHRQAW